MIIDAGATKVHLKPTQSCYLYSMGDIGFSGTRHCAESFDEDLAYLESKLAQGHEVRIFSTGDNLAATSPSERAALVSAKGGAGMYKDTLNKMDESVIADCDAFIKKFKPFKGKIIFIQSGHHFWKFSHWSIHHGLNSDQYIAKQLGCTYGGFVAYVDLIFPSQKYTARILAYHGNGNGHLPGSNLNRRYKAFEAFSDANYVFAGHDNLRGAVATGTITKGDDGQPKLSERRTVAIGSHEIAYKMGVVGDDYVEVALMRPTTTGNSITVFEPFNGRMRPRVMV